MTNQAKDDIKKELRKLWLIWAALLYTLFGYVRLCHLKENDIPYFTDAKLPLELLKYILFVTSFGILYVSYFYRRQWLKDTNNKFNNRIIKRAHKTGRPPVFLQYTSDVVFSGAISLLPGLLGLLFFFISKDWKTLYVFIAISAIALIYFRPNLKEFERYISNNDKGNKTAAELNTAT
jgi:hypothetical protein